MRAAAGHGGDGRRRRCNDRKTDLSDNRRQRRGTDAFVAAIQSVEKHRDGLLISFTVDFGYYFGFTRSLC